MSSPLGCMRLETTSSRKVWDFPGTILATSIPYRKGKSGRAKKAVIPAVLSYTARRGRSPTVKLKAVIAAKWFRPAMGAALAVLGGLLLWGTPLGDAWENASYDSLFQFGARAPTNRVALVLMDSDSYAALHQDRGNLWDRALHAQLLEKLTADGAQLVVFDVLFKQTNHPGTDAKLAEATGNNVVNMFYYGHANQDVMNGITDPTLKEAFSIDDPSILETTNFTPNLTAEQRDAWTAMWAEVKAAP